ncbi:hypothetical protein Ddye_003001 [Dipteronia dyeriana]|uniref:Reverse transcriptase zinc-binding domain-containing protein n=1 Tax=Dipteronia dyeriana TaxID=168575 RepID=A0AAD9XSL7_9ROSI|nr:hypothetical protein Ddye_003001 [Dipteronia dyeriana]
MAGLHSSSRPINSSSSSSTPLSQVVFNSRLFLLLDHSSASNSRLLHFRPSMAWRFDRPRHPLVPGLRPVPRHASLHHSFLPTQFRFRLRLHRCSGNKVDGGLGFRNLDLFNRALSATQCWRIISQPSSFAAKVLKSIYFPDSSFLDTECKGSSSFLWNSLVWGRGLLERGLRWRIGNGSSVAVYKDCWLPRLVTFKIWSPSILDANATVQSLITPLGVWNSELIHQSFNQDDTLLILSLPLSSFNSTDRLFWHYEKLGAYSVRSGYRSGCSLIQEVGTYGSNSSGLRWNCFWHLKIYAKVKHMLWRGCHNWIPTNAHLSRKGINISYLCPLCFRRIESTMHALWGCPSLKKMCSSCFLLSGIRFTDNLSFLDFLVDFKDRLSVTEFEVSCIIFWRVWCRRNEKVHQVVSLHDDDIVQWASSFISNYR